MSHGNEAFAVIARYRGIYFPKVRPCMHMLKTLPTSPLPTDETFLAYLKS